MKKLAAKLFTTTKLMPIALSMAICAGCTHYKVISSDKTVRRIKANEQFRSPIDGWFVPDARWLELRDALTDRIDELEQNR
jgi:hypothetical protein